MSRKRGAPFKLDMSFDEALGRLAQTKPTEVDAMAQEEREPAVPPTRRVPKPERPDNNIIQLVPAGKVRCFITGKLRPDTPEENVRQRWARSLVEEYRYSPDDIALEFSIKMGVERKRADIVVFKAGVAHKQENIFIILEAKHADVLPKARSEGVEQLKSYMAASGSCRYGLWVGSERQGFERQLDGAIIESWSDIPANGETEARVLTFAELAPAVSLVRSC